MKRNLFFALAATLLFFIFVWLDRSSGYVKAVALISPATFFLVVGPLFLIFYVFNMVSLIVWKTKNTKQLIVKVLMFFNLHILTVCNLMSSQIYVTVGTGLQTTMMIYVLAMSVVFVAFYAEHLYKKWKEDKKISVSEIN